jgi:serralysin
MCITCQQVNPFLKGCALEKNALSLAEQESGDAPGNFAAGDVPEISIGDVFTGFLSIGDTDFLSVYLTEGERYAFDLGGAASHVEDVSDTYLRIYDSAGNLAAENDDIDYYGEDFYSSAILSVMSSGLYYLEATTFETVINSTNGTDQGYYDLEVSQIPENRVMLTPEQIAARLLDWGGGTRYSWDINPGDTLTVDLDDLTSAGRELARNALDAWEGVIDISFQEVSGNADITFDDDEEGAFTTFEERGGYFTNAAVNVSTDWLADNALNGDEAALNSYNFQTYIHELGHALGLNHAGNYNGFADYEKDAEFLNDSWQMTMMSYFDQGENPYVDASFGYALTPQMADILAVQTLYGVPENIRNGNTTYGNNSTVGTYLDNMAGLAASSVIIFDSNGIDTIDLSEYIAYQRVYLDDGAFSNVLGGKGNMGISIGTIIENYEGGSGIDIVFGNEAGNRIDGNAGNDAIYAGAGDDELFGGDGADRLVGNAGNDTLSGEEGDDILKAKDGDMNELYGGAGNDKLIGSDSGDDLLSGGTGSDTIIGLDGTDLLQGGEENDYLYGGRGDDTVQGGSGDDLLRGNLNDDLLQGGDGSDRLFGGGQNDNLQGNAGRDYLLGENGDDTLDGGEGDDNLTGGAGADVFIYGAENYGYDRILDFEVSVDRIDLSTSSISDIDALYAAADDMEFGLRISFEGDGNRLFLRDITEAELGASDFIFV